MKKKLLYYLFIAIMFPTIFSSCKFEDLGEIKSYHFTATNNLWQWNSIYGRYECSFNFPELTKYIYENGTITGSIFINEEDSRGKWYETQKNLPFSQTYTTAQMPYTETISFDVSPGNPYYVTFYIQASDMQGVALQTYNFKITLSYAE